VAPAFRPGCGKLDSGLRVVSFGGAAWETACMTRGTLAQRLPRGKNQRR